MLLPSHDTTFINFTSLLGFDLYVLDPANQDVKKDVLYDDNLWMGYPILRSRNYHRFSGKLDTAV